MIALGIVTRTSPKDIVEFFVLVAAGAKRRFCKVFVKETKSKTVMVTSHATNSST